MFAEPLVASLPQLFLLSVIAEDLSVLCLDGFQFILVFRHVGQQLVKIKFYRLISSFCIKVMVFIDHVYHFDVMK